MTDPLKSLQDSELDALEAGIQAERQARQQKAREPKFPIKTKFYAHSGKDDNWMQAQELNLSEEAQRTFSYTGLEVEFDIVVDEKGNAVATHVNGVALVEPVEI